MNIYDKIAIKIIEEQGLLMGPIAWDQAGKVKGLQIVDKNKGIVSITDNGDGGVVINNLVGRFGNLFGPAGIEVCKDAARVLLADLQPAQIPSSLR